MLVGRFTDLHGGRRGNCVRHGDSCIHDDHLFLCGWMDLFPGALRGMGYSAVPMVLSVIGTVGHESGVIFGIFPYHRSLAILFISYPASWIITIILQVVCFYFVRRRVHRRSQALAGKNRKAVPESDRKSRS